MVCIVCNQTWAPDRRPLLTLEDQFRVARNPLDAGWSRHNRWAPIRMDFGGCSPVTHRLVGAPCSRKLKPKQKYTFAFITKPYKVTVFKQQRWDACLPSELSAQNLTWIQSRISPTPRATVQQLCFRHSQLLGLLLHQTNQNSKLHTISRLMFPRTTRYRKAGHWNRIWGPYYTGRIITIIMPLVSAV